MSGDTIHLIIIDDSSNHAETVANALRNFGHAVRAVRIEDDEDLRDALAGREADLILSEPAAPNLSAQTALEIIRQMELDIPLVVLDDGRATDQALEALEAGARDMVAPDETVRLVHVVLREVQDLHRRQRHRTCEKRLREANERAQGLVNSSRDAIAYVHDGMHIYANESYLNMFGYADFDEIEGMPLMDMVSPEHTARFKDFLRQYSRDDNESTLELKGQKADSTEFDLEMEFSAATYDGEPCTQIIIRDQSNSQELEKRLDELSKQDLLTGTLNRQFFYDQLDEVVRDTERGGAILYIEPDGFGGLREEIGIAAGDLILADIAGVMKEHVRCSALLSRFEAHMFTALLPGSGEAAAAETAETLRREVADYVAEVNGRSVSVTLSIGMVVFNRGMNDTQQVLARVDKARRQAVADGGNRVHIYNAVAEEMAERELNAIWERRLKMALRDGQFVLLYQPIVSLHGDANENYEVLLRMKDESGNVIAPCEFLPAAESTGLVVAVDRWVIGNAVKTLAERRKEGKATSFYVKLSQHSLREPKLLPWLRDLLKAARIDGRQLVLEVDEQAALNNLKALKVLSEGVQQLRIRLAIDHYGLAKNSARLLSHSHSDVVKIDGSFVAGMAQSPERQNAVREMAAAAREAGRQSIAPYVEDANTLASLWSCGVDYIQGYFLQQPDAALHYDFSAED